MDRQHGRGWSRCCPPRTFFGVGYLIDTACFAVVVLRLSGCSAAQFGPLAERVDRTLGEWSYFAFLAQLACRLLVAGIFFNGDWRGWTLLVAVTPVVLVASAAFAWLNRKLVEPLRDRVRHLCGPFKSAAPAAVPSETLLELGVVAEADAN